MTHFGWVSTSRFTVGVYVDREGIITGGAPYIGRFVGQPLKNLLRWSRRFGEVRSERIWSKP